MEKPKVEPISEIRKAAARAAAIRGHKGKKEETLVDRIDGLRFTVSEALGCAKDDDATVRLARPEISGDRVIGEHIMVRRDEYHVDLVIDVDDDIDVEVGLCFKIRELEGHKARWEYLLVVDGKAEFNLGENATSVLNINKAVELIGKTIKDLAIRAANGEIEPAPAS